MTFSTRPNLSLIIFLNGLFVSMHHEVILKLNNKEKGYNVIKHMAIVILEKSSTVQNTKGTLQS
jgi:hypothetical protein